jgi:hypothetical protein
VTRSRGGGLNAGRELAAQLSPDRARQHAAGHNDEAANDVKCRVGRRLIGELRRVIKHRHREQFRGRDEAGEGREPEIQPQRRKNDEDEIGQRHREGQSLGGPHRLHLQIQPNGGQAGFDQGAEIAARIGHVAALRQPRTDQPQHRHFEQDERHKGRSQLQDRGVTVPDPFDAVGRDRVGND